MDLVGRAEELRSPPARADTHGMEINGVDAASVLLDAQAGAIQAQLAALAAHKVMKIEKAMGQELVALLDPRVGANFDRRV